MGPIHFKPRGAGGLRNPVLESRPGPEATVLFLASQLDPRLSEIGQYYDFINEFVNDPDHFVAPDHKANFNRNPIRNFLAGLLPTSASGAIMPLQQWRRR
jgi:hypothetical protein